MQNLVHFIRDVYTYKEKMNGLTRTVNELSHTVKELEAEKERLEQRVKNLEEFLAWWNFRPNGPT